MKYKDSKFDKSLISDHLILFDKYRLIIIL